MENLRTYYFGNTKITINLDDEVMTFHNMDTQSAKDLVYPDSQLKAELGHVYGLLYE